MAITVTATWTGGSPTGRLLHVFVMTGGQEAGGNSARNVSGFNGDLAFTPAATNSWLVWSLYDGSGGNAFTSISNNTIQDNFSTTHGERFGDGYYTGTVTGGTGVTVGATSGNGSNVVGIAYEIKATGGTTPAIDASTPATVSATAAGTTLTTASFTPPGGAVLVAVIESNNSSTQCTIADSSSLTWTRRDPTADGGVIGIFTATTASGGVTSTGSFKLGPLGFAGTATETNSSTGSFKLGALGLAGTATETNHATGSFRLGPLGLAGQAQQGSNVTSTGTFRLGPLGFAGSEGLPAPPAGSETFRRPKGWLKLYGGLLGWPR